MLVLSHRGDHRHAHENTLDAFARAVALGVDGIETDLRRARDGEIILFHDRLAPDGREVSQLTRQELSAQIAAEVPRLDDALAAWPKLLWNLELKTPDVLPATIKRVRPFLDAGGRVVISSFWHDLALRATEALNCDGGLLVAHRPLDLARLPLAGNPVASGLMTIVWYWETLDLATLREAHQRGWHNWAYGLHTEADHQQAVAWKLDGVIADLPQRTLAALGRAPS